MRTFLATKQITVLEHPAYSPDLANSDFFMFQKIKEILKGRHFDDIDDIRSNTSAALKAIEPKSLQCSVTYTCKNLGIFSLLGLLNTKYFYCVGYVCMFQLRGLRRGSEVTRLMGLRIRIP
jgi:hypothetical protein